MIETLIYKKIFDEAYQILKSSLKEKGFNLVSNDIDIQKNIVSHITYVDNWSKEISFRDLGANCKTVKNIFIELDYLITPKSCIVNETPNTKVQLKDIFNKADKHYVIIGQPGSGKTTTMKYISQQTIHNEDFYPELFSFPIVIRLRTLRLEDETFCGILFDKIIKVLGIRVNNIPAINVQFAKDYVKSFIIEFISKIKPLIILDGFDEITPIGNKEKVLLEFEELVLSLTSGKVFLTSRSGDFPYQLDNTALFETAPLTDTQVVQLSKNWLKNDIKSEDFIKKINKSPFKDSSIRPLTISHLCAIYERYGDIPEKPKTVYRKIVNLLIEDWDEQRNIKRVSQLGIFDPDRKTDFLSELSYYTSVKLKKSIFNKQELVAAYEQIYEAFNLPKNESKKVISEIETHTGLFIRSGFDSFEFVHKSIQEYLTALYIVRLPTTPDNANISEYLPNEFAIAVSLASDQTAYFYSLVFITIMRSYKQKKLVNEFFNVFISRLIIEKPDFKPNVFLGVAFLFLLHMAYAGSSNAKLDGDVFDNLFNNSAIQKSISLIKSHYVISPQSHLGFNLIELEKHHEQPSQFLFKLPDTISIKKKYYLKCFNG